MLCSLRLFPVAKYPEDVHTCLDHSRQSHDHSRQSDQLLGVTMLSRSMRTPLLAIPAICLLLAACSKVSADNYAKIKVGMEYKEVASILGNPASCDDVAGFKACRWGDDKSQIAVRFAGDKVVLHSAENIR
jgi:hypothetical protein